MLPVLLEHKHKIGNVLFIGQDKIGVFVYIGLFAKFDIFNLYFSIGFKTLFFKIVNYFDLPNYLNNNCNLIDLNFKNEKYRIINTINLYEISLVSNPTQYGVNCYESSRKEFFQFLPRFRN